MMGSSLDMSRPLRVTTDAVRIDCETSGKENQGVFSLQMNKCFPCIPSGLGYDVDTFLQFFTYFYI